MAKIDALKGMTGIYDMMFFSCNIGLYIFINEVLFLLLFEKEISPNVYWIYGALSLLTIIGMIAFFMKLTANLNEIRQLKDGNKNELEFLKEKASAFRTLLRGAGIGMACIIYWVTHYLPHYNENYSTLNWSLGISALILLLFSIFISLKLFKIAREVEPL
jgi:uncharacterized membrane protein